MHPLFALAHRCRQDYAANHFTKVARIFTPTTSWHLAICGEGHLWRYDIEPGRHERRLCEMGPSSVQRRRREGKGGEAGGNDLGMVGDRAYVSFTDFPRPSGSFSLQMGAGLYRDTASGRTRRAS